MNNRQGSVRTAGEIAEVLQAVLRGTTYNAGAAALVAVLGRWIAERSLRPVADSLVLGSALEVLVEEISRVTDESDEAQNVAA